VYKERAMKRTAMSDSESDDDEIYQYSNKEMLTFGRRPEPKKRKSVFTDSESSNSESSSESESESGGESDDAVAIVQTSNNKER